MSVTECEISTSRPVSDSDFYCTGEELFNSFMDIVNEQSHLGVGSDGVTTSAHEQRGASNNNCDENFETKNCYRLSNGNEEESSNLLENVADSSLKDMVDQDVESKVETNSNAEICSALEKNEGLNIEHERQAAEQEKINIVDQSESLPLSKPYKAEEVLKSSQTVEIVSHNRDSDQVNGTNPSDSKQLENEDDNGSISKPSGKASYEAIEDGTEMANNGDNSVKSGNNDDDHCIDKETPCLLSSVSDEQDSSVNDRKDIEQQEESDNSQTAKGSDKPDQHSLLSDEQKKFELQLLESNIEEGIKRATRVCDEINEFISQRLSQSSDELLGDDESGRRSLLFSGSVEGCRQQESNAPKVEPPPAGDTSALSRISMTNPTYALPLDGNLNENMETQACLIPHTSNNQMIDEIDATAERESKINVEKCLPKLIVTKPPLDTAPSSTSPVETSSARQLPNGDTSCERKSSVSDSLESSEGSLSGDTKSIGTPTGSKEPINWEILNSAFDYPETDEDECVYETGNHYGGFGLILEEEPAADMEPSNTLMVEDEDRLRTVSEASTLSEAEFRTEYKKQHTAESLDRKIDGVICSGFLVKVGGTGLTPKNWRKRWCVLRHDRCLYYYKSARDKEPCGIIVLANYIVSHSSEGSKKNCIKLSKGGGRTYFFASDSQDDKLRWMEFLRKAADNGVEGASFEIRQEIIHNVAIPALSIKKPDCHGYLTKQGGRNRNSWKRRYCVLKNGCLYYYREMADTTALGVAKLHGYTVEEGMTCHGRRNGFRAVPPHSGMRTFYFVADNEYDKRRWVPCFEESIRKNTSS